MNEITLQELLNDFKPIEDCIDDYFSKIFETRPPPAELNEIPHIRVFCSRLGLVVERWKDHLQKAIDNLQEDLTEYFESDSDKVKYIHRKKT